MKYRHIIFDADHTIIDFQKDERRALKEATLGIPPSKVRKLLSTAGIPPSDMPTLREQLAAHLQAYSLRNWTELGLDNVHEEAIQKRYHELTYVHVHDLFAYAQKECALEDAEAAKRIFFETLCLPAHPLEGALEVVKELSTRFSLSVATNGLAQMQRGRLKEFKPYLTHLFISEEMNTIKPAQEFGRVMLETLQAKAEECLFVGDSLASDIALANRLGMDAVWYNPNGRPLPESVTLKGQITALNELFKYI